MTMTLSRARRNAPPVRERIFAQRALESLEMTIRLSSLGTDACLDNRDYYATIPERPVVQQGIAERSGIVVEPKPGPGQNEAVWVEEYGVSH